MLRIGIPADNLVNLGFTANPDLINKHYTKIDWGIRGLVRGGQGKVAKRGWRVSSNDGSRSLIVLRELDVIWNGEEGAAKQASLCDMVGQIAEELPALRAENEKLRKELGR